MRIMYFYSLTIKTYPVWGHHWTSVAIWLNFGWIPYWTLMWVSFNWLINSIWKVILIFLFNFVLNKPHLNIYPQTRIKFNPTMGKQSYLLQSVGWNHLSISKHRRCRRWCLEMSKHFHPIFYRACDYFSMREIRLMHVSKSGSSSQQQRTRTGIKSRCILNYLSWRLHQVETFFALLAFCAGNSPVSGALP